MAGHTQPLAFAVGLDREREHVEMALRFANARTDVELFEGLEFLALSQWPHLPVSASKLQAQAKALVTQLGKNSAAYLGHLRTIREVHDDLRSRVATIATDLKAARHDLEGPLNADLARVLRKAELKNGVLIESVIDIQNGIPADEVNNPRAVAKAGRPFSAGLGYVLALLLDSRRPFGPALRQCALEECTNYFLSMSRGGGPKPRYCCLEHTKEADSARAAERMATLRANARARRHK